MTGRTLDKVDGHYSVRRSEAGMQLPRSQVVYADTGRFRDHSNL